MRIGELAGRTGASTRSLRYYEQHGLITSRRGANGYREYAEDDVRLVEEIRTLLSVGFTLEDTRPFVNCLRAGHEKGGACRDSAEVYRRKLVEIDDEIRTLLARRAEVSAQLGESCSGCMFSIQGER
ncbi:MerR family transcriptional regulator [Nonomuraea roseoviolacea subsp. roseoviolacea]|uniref:DNA-binding transcriptional MerR regulator n=1 Tax=Nonomuraea roseoviolacea subsp. carminata TaxID=160689 RepID=A0ABT1K129_9ACTN|nr:MerR family transcriptional regulator [Nonomuraea roseoviolacea]MCP2347702.1 DNA-binding transcriptional MerR regulator [Nonomuraea roseoviolacea subsp. carminata]